MARMIGLRYTGNKRNGISLVLYRSYKTVSLTPIDNYKFSDSDNVSAEAKKHYESLNKPPYNLKIEVVMDEELSVHTEDGPKDSGNNHGTDNGTVNIPNDPDNPAEPTQDGEAPSDLAAMSDSEFAEYLEMNLDIDKLKSIVAIVNPEADTSRKRSAALVKLIIEAGKDKALEALNSLK